MDKVFLINYSVRGIKSLDKDVILSFYNRTISKTVNTQQFNVKGIYGMNGAGKSAIISSVGILKNLILDSNYLNNPIVQIELDSLINKKLGELTISVDFLSSITDDILLYRYTIIIRKDYSGKYVISTEKLLTKKATSKSDNYLVLYSVENGQLVDIVIGNSSSNYSQLIIDKTKNLLDSASLSSLFLEKIVGMCSDAAEFYSDAPNIAISNILIFASKIKVYLDQTDDHKKYYLKDYLSTTDFNSDKFFDYIKMNSIEYKFRNYADLSYDEIRVSKNLFNEFTQDVDGLYEFLHVFKSDLIGIDIDRKDDKEEFVCSLVMVYSGYRINAEFESTGIKKLIKLYTYLDDMVNGCIVFIDEFDSNLHDVYLCALLEYLMENAQGQLCFTTHNVGPMDILKCNKKSIDFLSVDHTIYPWIKSGNYSPASLYRKGMIDGCPFNVDSIDFIGVFNQDDSSCDEEN